MRIAVAQISCALGDVTANLSKIREFSSDAKKRGADVIVFPEMADTGYSMPVIKTKAGRWSEGAVPELRRIARELSLLVVSGVSERVEERIYNSQIVIDANGGLVAQYRKAHLFAASPIAEDRTCSPGQKLGSFAAGSLKFGLSICYDLRFPELYRSLVLSDNVNVFILSSAWPFPRVEHFRILATARAIENQSYFIVAKRVGTDDGVTFCGSSVIIDPYGVVLAAAATDREELLIVDISYDTVSSIRQQMAVFAHRRPELYNEDGV